MEIKLFGIVKDIVGSNSLTLANTEPVTSVGELKKTLALQYPALRQLKSMAVAVNYEYADDTLALQADSEIALIPPVSGG